MNAIKLLPLAALASLALSLTACKDPLEAFADDVCACKDKECIDKVVKDYETKAPETKAKLGEIDKLPENKKKALGKAMECMMKQAK